LSDYYVWGREYCSRKNFYIGMVSYDLYSFVGGAFIFYVFYFGQGIYNEEGQLFGLFAYGVFSTICIVIVHHAQVGMYTRNWTWFQIAWFLLSVAFCPITVWLNDNRKNAELYKSIYPNLLSAPLFWLMMLLASAMVFLPIYAFKQWTYLIKYPKYFARD